MIQRIVGIQLYPWDQVNNYEAQDVSLRIGDRVVVKTNLGLELGTVVSLPQSSDLSDGQLKQILRKANTSDIDKAKKNYERKQELLSSCRDLIKKYKLEMKLVDCFFSFDGGRITFTFTAPGRVDFRNLVKELTRQFQKSVRLQQVGIRDEAKRLAEFGSCGRGLCCKQFLHNLGNVTTELARVQQLSQRGSGRISGACGRLMCCLAYEAEFYKEQTKNFPPVDSFVKIKDDSTKAKVISWNVLKKSVLVENEDRSIVELQLSQFKKL